MTLAKWSCREVGEGSIKWLKGVAGVAVPANRDQPHRVINCYEFMQAHSPLPYTVFAWKKQQQRRHWSEGEPTKGCIPLWKHVPNNRTKSRFLNKRQKKRRFFWIFPQWLNVCKPQMGVDMQGFGCWSNAAHRLGKYMCRPWLKLWACCCYGQPALKQQNWTQDPDSGLPEWLPQCADLHCNVRSLSFIFRYASWQSALNKTQTQCRSLVTHAYLYKHIYIQYAPTNTHMMVIYHPLTPIKALHLERMNHLHSFFPQSGAREKMSCCFHQRKTQSRKLT